MSLAPQVLLNDELLPAAAAKVSALSEGFQFGLGAFETIRVQQGRPMFVADHRDRLAGACAELDLESPPPAEEMARRILRLLAAVSMPYAAVKVMRYRDFSRTAELITARTSPYSPADYLRGYGLKSFVQGARDGRITGRKTLNYLENLLARRTAREAGRDEALFVTPDGRLLEGSTTSVFLVRDGVALTPPLSAGILPGVARAKVLALLGENRGREADLTIEDMHTASEMFVTNALLGVMPVCAVDEHKFRAYSPVTTEVRQGFLALAD